MPPKRILTADEQADVKRQRIEQMRIYRENMTEEQIAHKRDIAAERYKTTRNNMTTEERDLERDRIAQQVRKHRAQSHRVITKEGISESAITPHNCGQLSEVCNFCNALHFAKERPNDKLFSQCCQKGKVTLLPIKLDPLIQRLMTHQHEYSKNFHNNIRSLNSALAFTSMGANIAPLPGYGPYCFRINGQIYHRTGSLHPQNDDNRQFAQLYILDPQEASIQRLQINENSACNSTLINELSNFMATNNPFADACKMLYEVEQECLNDAVLIHQMEQALQQCLWLLFRIDLPIAVVIMLHKEMRLL